MRPTFLRYRSPKEQTGEFVNTPVTYGGACLTFAPIYPRAKSTFPRSKRFEHIDSVANRTSYRVGPGCYNYSFSTNKGVSANIRPDSAIPKNHNKEIEYVYADGNTIVKQEISHPCYPSQSLGGTRTSFGFSPASIQLEPNLYNIPFSRGRRYKPGHGPEKTSVTEHLPGNVMKARNLNILTTEPERSLSARRILKTNGNTERTPEKMYLRRPNFTPNRARMRHSSIGNKTMDTSAILNSENELNKTLNSFSRRASPKPYREVELLKQSINLNKVQFS